MDNKDLSASERAYIISIKQFMFKGKDGIGNITFSNKDLAERINMSECFIRKCSKSLVEKGFLDEEDSKLKHGVKVKNFHLDKLGDVDVRKVEKNVEIKENYITRKIDALKKAVKKLCYDVEAIKSLINSADKGYDFYSTLRKFTIIKRDNDINRLEAELKENEIFIVTNKIVNVNNCTIAFSGNCLSFRFNKEYNDEEWLYA